MDRRQFIVFAEWLADGGHVASSEADARKGAYTNAFKKAAAFFGCGNAAYEGSIDDDNIPADPTGDRVTVTTLATQLTARSCFRRPPPRATRTGTRSMARRPRGRTFP